MLALLDCGGSVPQCFVVWLGPRNLNCHKGAAEVLEHRAGQAFSAAADSSQRTPEGLARAGAFSDGL